MRNTIITKQTCRYLALLIALAVSAALASGSGLHSTGYAGYSSGGNVSGGSISGDDVAILECRRVGANAKLEEATWFLAGDAGVLRTLIVVRAAGSSADVTTLYLDRNGADIPEGNWWRISDDASNAVVAGVDGHRGPDITTLNLDRDGADISAD